MINRRLSKREEKILAICLMALFVYVSHNVIFKTLKEKEFTLGQKIKVEERCLKKELRLIKRSHFIDQEWDKLSTYFKQKKSDEEEMSFILSQIETIASEMNIRLTDLKPKKVKKVDFYNTFSVSVNIDGTTKQIARFVYNAQSSPHHFDITDLRIEKGSSRKSLIKCYVSLSKVLIP